MPNTPLEAFTDFLTMYESVSSVSDILEQKSEDYYALLDPFLANPERHREHVRLIADAATTARIGQALHATHLLGPMRLAAKLTGSSGALKEHQLQFRERLQTLRNGLVTEIEPGEFGFDILPSRLPDTPPEWARQGLRLHLIELRLGIVPHPGLEVESLNVRVELDAQDPTRITDALPGTESTEVGEYEVGLATRGKFVRTGTAEAGLQLGLAKSGVKLSAGASASVTSEHSTEQRASYTMTAKQFFQKVLSSAASRTALWQLQPTPEQAIAGTLPFYLTVLTPKQATTLPMKVRIETSMSNWGPMLIENSVAASLSRPG
jgi:hypothetical protein